jgi:tRNA(fMet)-specific endonuclease VapC
MSGRYLLDTNIMIALFTGETSVIDRLGQIDETFVPSIALGELYHGARKSSRVQENLMRIEEFAARNAALSCDTETARRYGEVKDQLRRKGRPIPGNDIWIAAIALQYDLTLVARDVHFREVDNLRVEAW